MPHEQRHRFSDILRNIGELEYWDLMLARSVPILSWPLPDGGGKIALYREDSPLWNYALLSLRDVPQHQWQSLGCKVKARQIAQFEYTALEPAEAEAYASAAFLDYITHLSGRPVPEERIIRHHAR